jgi:hypothetical protein
LVAGAFLVAVALSASANAATLRRGSSAGGASVTGSLPGQVEWSYYETTSPLSLCSTDTLAVPESGCDNAGNGDNIIRVINPTGSASPGLIGQENLVCAMIYVFDDDEEMGECCGCPVTSAGLVTFSVERDLISNWTTGLPNPGIGAIAIVAAPINISLIVPPGGGASNGQGCSFTQSAACTVGCDPTSSPGYTVTTANNLFESITHNQVVTTTSGPNISGLTEIGFFDDAGGDPTNLTYLQHQCAAGIGNGSHTGICRCPGGSSEFGS